MSKNKKIVTLNELLTILDSLRLKNILNDSKNKNDAKKDIKKDIKIVFTNGCFDILHTGHVSYLKNAKKAGDFLIVGLNSDDSVRSIKGDKRPIVSQEQRADVVASLECVDYVTIFSQLDPLNIIQAIKPNILVKGADWKENDIVGADFIKLNGGKVVRIELSSDISTSILIKRIIERYCKITC